MWTFFVSIHVYLKYQVSPYEHSKFIVIKQTYYIKEGRLIR